MTKAIPEVTLEFYKVPNDSFRGKNHERGLTPNAVRLYCILEQYRLHYYRNLTITNIDILSSLVEFCNRDDRNKKAIRKILTELQSKGYITIEHDGDELKSNTEMLKITTPANIEGGFVKVTTEIFSKITDHDEFALMCVILKNNDWERNSVSQDELADSIQCDRKKAGRVAQRLADKGFIVIKEGGYYSLPSGQVRKGYNTYKPSNVHKYMEVSDMETDTTVDVEQLERVVGKEQGVLKQPVSENYKQVEDFDKGRWVTKDFPQYEDYRIYREHKGKNAEFDKRCEKRIEGTRRNNSKTVREWEQTYECERKKKSKITAEKISVKGGYCIVVELSSGEQIVYDDLDVTIDYSDIAIVYSWQDTPIGMTFESRDVSGLSSDKLVSGLSKKFQGWKSTLEKSISKASFEQSRDVQTTKDYPEPVPSYQISRSVSRVQELKRQRMKREREQLIQVDISDFV